MNILITGSTGFVGAALAESLINQGFNVVGFDIAKTNDKSYYPYEQGNICDFPRLASVIQQYKIDTIVHTGGLSHPSAGINSAYQLVQTNIVGTVNVYEAAKLYSIKKVIYLSAAGVYGEGEQEEIKEDGKTNPNNLYAISKLTGEHLANIFASEYDMDIVSLRLAFVYGPERRMPDPIKSMLERALIGNRIQDKKGIDQKLEFIYIKDVVHAIELVLNKTDLKSGSYNIGSGVKHSIGDISKIVKDIFPEITIEIGPGSLGYDDLPTLDCFKAKKELSFEIQYPLERGIHEYAAELKKY